MKNVQLSITDFIGLSPREVVIRGFESFIIMIFHMCPGEHWFWKINKYFEQKVCNFSGLQSAYVMLNILKKLSVKSFKIFLGLEISCRSCVHKNILWGIMVGSAESIKCCASPINYRKILNCIFLRKKKNGGFLPYLEQD